MKKIILATGCLIIIFSANGSADSILKYRSKYADHENLQIKSLSKKDISELMNGKGRGMAKAAELNGFPGPLHLLEMKKEIRLNDEQIKQIEQLYRDMKTRAVFLATKLIDLERELNQSFIDKTIDNEALQKMLSKISTVQKDLRYVHLAAHLKTPEILTAVQIDNYNRLRGYNSDDPCRTVPKGHNPEMWKTHNNCD